MMVTSVGPCAGAVCSLVVSLTSSVTCERAGDAELACDGFYLGLH